MMGKQEETIKSFVRKAYYDEAGQVIFAEGPNGGQQLLVEVRGWGRIMQMFTTEAEAATFQDEVGRFIADAINEKAQSVPGRFIPESEIQKLKDSHIKSGVSGKYAVYDFLQAIEKGGANG